MKFSFLFTNLYLINNNKNFYIINLIFIFYINLLIIFYNLKIDYFYNINFIIILIN